MTRVLVWSTLHRPGHSSFSSFTEYSDLSVNKMGRRGNVLVSDYPHVELPKGDCYNFIHGKLLEHGSNLALVSWPLRPPIKNICHEHVATRRTLHEGDVPIKNICHEHVATRRTLHEGDVPIKNICHEHVATRRTLHEGDVHRLFGLSSDDPGIFTVHNWSWIQFSIPTLDTYCSVRDNGRHEKLYRVVRTYLTTIQI